MTLIPAKPAARALTLVLAAWIGVLLTPAESQAIFHWFSRCCGATSTPTYANYVAPVNPCGRQVVNYIPQTCYETQYVTVPVTTYRPTVAYDACGGCPTTVMRPWVGVTRQARYFPYSSYRIVVSPPSYSSYYGAPVYTSSYAPSSYYAPSYSSGCSNCSVANGGGNGVTYGAYYRGVDEPVTYGDSGWYDAPVIRSSEADASRYGDTYGDTRSALGYADSAELFQDRGSKVETYESGTDAGYRGTDSKGTSKSAEADEEDSTPGPIPDEKLNPADGASRAKGTSLRDRDADDSWDRDSDGGAENRRASRPIRRASLERRRESIWKSSPPVREERSSTSDSTRRNVHQGVWRPSNR